MSQQQMQAISVEQAKRICPIIAIALMGGVVIALVFMFPFELFNGPIPKQGINFPGTYIATATPYISAYVANRKSHSGRKLRSTTTNFHSVGKKSGTDLMPFV